MNIGWNYRIGVLVMSLCFTFISEAKVKLPALVSDGMVLQRGQPLTVWGMAEPGEAVTVTFLKKKYASVADTQGNWQVALPAMKPGGPYTMEVNDIRLENVLIGDVWLCSGQSNMELPVSRVTDLFRTEAETYSNPMIRHIKIPLIFNFHAPQSDVLPTSWKVLTPENALSFSALAYFFAKELYAKTGIPVGIINSSVGGSPVEAWISEEGLKPFPLYINEKHIYESDELNAETARLERMKQQAWNVALYRGDAGLHDATPWYAADYDDSSWQRTDLFATEQVIEGGNGVNGSHWFRREFDIPQSLAGKDAVLRMGCIVDADSVYINGTFVGTVAYQYPPRIYSVPGNLLKAGKNTITVRLISYSGYPHFVKEKPYRILFKEGNASVSLEGEWKYRKGTPMIPASGQTFFQYKPVGLYNAMIAPLLKYTTAGVIWYQGESNVERRSEYASLLTGMIGDWRQKMEQPELPFYIIELADFLSHEDTAGRKAWAEFREIQAKVASSLRHVTLVRNSDLGEWNDIHPLDKKTLGQRVAKAVCQ